MNSTKSAENKNRKAANALLATLTSNNYFDGLPVDVLGGVLEECGFDREPLYGVYTGREGRVHEQVGANTWFTMTWYKMEVTGRYEVVAYLS